MKKIITILLCCTTLANYAQTSADSLLNEIADTDKPAKENVYTTFKSPRIIMTHSAEMLPAGVLDFRILHRFGTIKNGVEDMFGLDYASMRMSFDYGITKHVTVGLGRSTFNKEIDLFVKARLLQQQDGKNANPLTIGAVLGTTVSTATYINKDKRTAYYAQLILARKFSEHFALQLTPTYLNRKNLLSAKDEENVIAMGVGSRVKLTNRVHIIADAFPTFSGVDTDVFKMPLSIGFDIETGGHVFQLHFSNSRGMNENAFLTSTTQKWDKGDISFGFNLSRVFTVKKNKVANF